MHSNSSEFIKVLIFIGFIAFQFLSKFLKNSVQKNKSGAPKNFPSPRPQQTSRRFSEPKEDLWEALGKKESDLPLPPIIPPLPKEVLPLKNEPRARKLEQGFSPLPTSPEIDPLPSLSLKSEKVQEKETDLLRNELMASLRDRKKIRRAFLFQEILREAPGLRPDFF